MSLEDDAESSPNFLKSTRRDDHMLTNGSAHFPISSSRKGAGKRGFFATISLHHILRPRRCHCKSNICISSTEYSCMGPFDLLKMALCSSLFAGGAITPFYNQK